MAELFRRVPAHLGIIMDGNGRWAKKQGLSRIEGHKKGAERARELVRILPDYGIKAATLYTFSLENWQRPEKETGLLMKLLATYLKRDMHELLDEGVRFKAIGETWRLPPDILALVKKTEELTAANDRVTLLTALSYGGRNEIVRAARRAVESGMSPDEITEESFGALLDTFGVPDPDLIIRTSGEKRLSNFLPWQAAYSEFYFTETLWPDFDRAELEKALREYEKRDRRFGAVNEEDNLA